MLLHDLADYLSSQGHGLPGVDIFEGAYPGSVDGLITVLLPTGGLYPIRAMASAPGLAKMERPRVQVVVRGDSYATVDARINNVFLSMDGLPQRLINGTIYFAMMAVQSPFMLPPDPIGRIRKAFNCDVWKALSTSSST